MKIIAPNSYLPDTNLLIHYIRDSSLYRWIETQYPLSLGDSAPILSILIVGEIRSFAARQKWGQVRIERLDDYLARSVVLPLEYPGVIEAYVELDTYSHKVGRRMGDNDLWIAATSQVTGAILLTTDKDFDHLAPDYIAWDWIDPNAL